MSRPPYSMYLYARSARGPPYPIYLYAGSASRPPYPIYLYARYASRPPCPIYLCAGSAGRPPYPIYLYVGLLAIVIMYSSIPSRLVYIFTDATIRNLKYSKKQQQKKKGNPPTRSKPSVLSGSNRYASTSKALAQKNKKTKPTKGNLPTWSTKRTLRPLHQMDFFFPGVANRYASTSKALVRVIKFRYSFTSSSPPSNELLRIKLLLAHTR